jgi:plasmid stability protein
MKTLHLRNVPDEVASRLQGMANRAGLSLTAFAVRELTAVARQSNNAALLAELPDLGVSADLVLNDLAGGPDPR